MWERLLAEGMESMLNHSGIGDGFSNMNALCALDLLFALFPLFPS